MTETGSPCAECGTPTDGVSRFCGRCGAQLVRAPARETPAAESPSPTDDVVASPPEELRPDRGRPRRALLVMGALSILAGALAVASLRDAPERVTAWGERGGAARDGVTSDRAVEDVSTDLWRAELESDESFLVGFLPRDVVPVDDALVLTGDRVAVLDAETLERRWDAPLGPTDARNVGEDGITVATPHEILTVAVETGRITRRVPIAEDIGLPWASDLLERPGGRRHLLVTTQRGLVALDTSDGSVVWRHAPGGLRKSVDLIDVGPELVLGHTPSGMVVALDPDTGAVRWERELWEHGPWFERWHQHVGDVLVVSVAEPEAPVVLGLDAATGELRWRHEVEGHVELAFVEDDRVLLRPREPGRDEPSWVEADTGRLIPAGDLLDAVPPTDEARFLSATEVLVSTEQGTRLVGPDGTVWTASVDGLPWSLPVVHGDRVFLPTGSGAMAVLDRSTGRELIRHHLPRDWHRPLVLVGDHVDPAPGNGRLLRLLDGRPSGEDDIGSGHWSNGQDGAPWGRLYHDADGDVIAVDHDGIERWRRDRSDRTDWNIVAALDDVVLLHETTYPVQPDREPPPAELVVLDAETGLETDREAAPLDRPVSDGASIWGYTWQRDATTELVRLDLDADEGELQLAWRRPAPPGQLILAGDRLLDVGGATAVVRDPGDGSVSATLALPIVVAGAPVVVGELLIVTDASRWLHAVRLTDGGTAWDHELSASLVADVVAAGDRLYLATADGELEVLETAGGRVVARRDLAPPGRTSGGLFAARGMVVVRFDDMVYAVGGPDGPRGFDRRRGGRIELP